MRGFWPEPEFCAFLVPALGGPALGLILWLGRLRLGVVVSVLLACWSGLALAAGQPERTWLPAALLSALFLMAAAVRQCHQQLLRLLTASRAQALLFLSAGPLAAVGWVALVDFHSHTPPEVRPPVSIVAEGEPIPLVQQGFTDLGRVVPLFTRWLDETVAAQLRYAERCITGAHPLALIRTAEPDPASNCHGWVFTAGRCSIRGEEVDWILADNGYREVTKPQPGDLIIYRNPGGRVLHTGLVRPAADDLILIESKWGHLGRYLHTPDNQPFGCIRAFYRSPRRNHLIRVDDSELATEQAR